MADLLTTSRIESAVQAAGGTWLRLDRPEQLPPADEVHLLVVDWAARSDGWAEALTAWRGGGPPPRVVLFGPHTDVAAHKAARAAGLGPMRARSAFYAALPALLSGVGDGGSEG